MARHDDPRIVLAFLLLVPVLTRVRETPHTDDKNVPFGLLKAGWETLRNPAFLPYIISGSMIYAAQFMITAALPYLVVTMWCALALLRALDTGARRYAFWALFAAALAFCMMESSIFFFAACIGFLAVMTAIDWLRWRHAPADGIRRPPGNVLLFVPRVRGENPASIQSPSRPLS